MYLWAWFNCTAPVGLPETHFVQNYFFFSTQHDYQVTEHRMASMRVCSPNSAPSKSMVQLKESFHSYFRSELDTGG